MTQLCVYAPYNQGNLRDIGSLPMTRTVLSLIVFLLFCVGSCRMAFAQNDGRLHLPPLAEQSQGMDSVPVKTAEQIQQERLMKMHELRQEEIRRDTQKLYQLSGELKDYLEKNGSVILSVDMIKKAETIEKLAHGIRQKMRDQ
jgi:hypothetical protein